MKIINGIECDPYKIKCKECENYFDSVWNESGKCDRCKYKKRRSSNYITRIRGNILKRDNYTCQICKENGSEVHHIDKDHHNNSDDNLICLCISCHGIIHRKEIDKYKYPKTRINKTKETKKIEDKEKPIYFLNTEYYSNNKLEIGVV